MDQCLDCVYEGRLSSSKVSGGRGRDNRTKTEETKEGHGKGKNIELQ